MKYESKFKDASLVIFGRIGLNIDNFLETLLKYKKEDWKIMFNKFNIYYSNEKKHIIYNFYFMIDFLTKEKKMLLKKINYFKKVLMI